MRINQVVNELTTRLELGGKPFDENNPCTLCFDGKYSVSLQADTQDQSLLLSGLVGPTPRSEEELRELLQASCLGANTGGCAFGLAPDTGELLLWKRLPDELPDSAALEQALLGFLAQLNHWQQQTETAPTGRSSVAGLAEWNMLRV
ncbi:hypothetical protein FACS1894116_03230 [Betaproteobacteria bacterium]|nr:hypothetical protein FACS1894116_03230 [Betaproteobacteria bacterium]GHU07933.1 hypothetical protein AGMMS50225_05670 [Betaproteobacteria bacterium]GHU22229.1 hypothetical protein FACS189488_02360 [Betaproteobacteria bacterium]GHU27941.1 hypothetical protein FACS189497_02190 [Betaproteobacteria bacterium]